MRKIKKVVSTGCFFLCVGGWVYSGQLNAADEITKQQEVTQVREAVLNAAVADAAKPDAAAEAPTPAAAQMQGAGPVATSPADTTTVSNPVATPSTMPAIMPATEPAITNVTPVTPVAATPSTRPTDLQSAVVSVGVDGKIDQINMQDIDINTALHLISLQTKCNIIASKDVKGTVTINLYNVTFSEVLDSMLRPNGFDYIEKGNFIYVYTTKELEDIKRQQRHTVNRVFRLKYINAQDASVLLKPIMSSTAAIVLTPAAVSGLTSGTADIGGMSYNLDDTLVVNDFPENLDEMGRVLKQIDVRPKQVLIEATVLDATLKDDNGMGVDLVSLSGLNFSDIGSAISPLSGSASTATGTGSTTATNVTTPGQVAGTLIPGVANKQFDGGTNFANTVPSGGLSVGFLSNHISVFLRALETVTDTTVVANPKILALNKQKGEVHIGQRLGYLTTTTSSTTTTQTVQFLDTGVKLIFRPFIADEGNIHMEIHPENSSGNIDSRGIPQTQTTEVTSNVLMHDGRTYVIGGLFKETTQANKGQVPILGNIPILGVPFRSTNDSTERDETIVLVTPHIINDDTAYYEESLKESEDVTRMMLGNRSGLQITGRDRIAHLWLGKAQDEMAAGHKEKALMFTDWALNTNPRMIEAIKLREQITNKKMDEAIESSVANLVKNVLSGDAATTPDQGGSGVYPPQMPATAPADNK